MTEAQRASAAIKLDEASLARAATRWGAFFASLEDDECELLDRFALGDNLKAICFELGLSYDAIRKRLARRQDALGLPSTATFLHFWLTVRGLGRAASDPTMLRYAESLRASLGYTPPMVLPAPDKSQLTLQLSSRAWRPARSATARERAEAEAITTSVLSTPVWHATLVATMGTDPFAATVPDVMAQHEVFQRLVLPERAHGVPELLHDRIARLLNSATASWLGPMLALGVTRSPLLSAPTALPWPPPGTAPDPVAGCDGAFEAAADSRFARAFCASVAGARIPDIQALLRTVDEAVTYGPLTGFALSLSFFHATSPVLRSMISPVLNRIISDRVHLCESLGVHPALFSRTTAMLECGVSASHEDYQLLSGEKLPALAAEQLLKEVRSISSTAMARTSHR